VSEYTYEGMFLLDSNRFSADADGTTKSVLGMLERVGATVVASRPWQDAKLCFPIKKQRKGLYYLSCFKLDGDKLPELTRICKLNDNVLRQMFIRHEPVIFDAMVNALNSEDGTIHAPEQRESRDGGDRRDGRDRGDEADFDKFN
jgi:small subunit ribosomal protein S6